MDIQKFIVEKVKEIKAEVEDEIAVRCIESKDARTAEVTEIPYYVLKKIVERITTEVPGVIKVVYDITPKPPSTIEYI